MLERSKEVPISVTILSAFPPKMKPIIVKALSQLSRFKSLTISDISGFVQAQSKNMTGEATWLEALQLDVRSSGGWTLPATFLAGGSPRLRRVSISGWQATWNSPFLQGLTFLKWYFDAENRSFGRDPGLYITPRSDPADFVSALENMPMLEELDLSGAFPAFAGALEGIPAPLTHLKKLRLVGSVEECAGALKCMALPPSVIVKIKFSTGNSDTDAPALLSALHSSWISNPLNMPNPLPPFASLQIVDEACPWPVLCLFVEYIDDNMWTRATAALTLEILSHTALRQITAALPADNIRFLYLGDNADITTELSQLRNLQSVVLRENSAARFIQALKEDPAFRSNDKLDLTKPSEPGVVVTVFPALKSLKLSQVDFINKQHRFLHALDLEDLLDVLIWRYEHGGGIEKISLESCHELWEEGVSRIREVVADVVWDKFEETRFALKQSDEYSGVSDDPSMYHDEEHDGWDDESF